MANKKRGAQLPETLEELCDYILQWKDDIYIREQINGKWDAYALSSLPPDKAIEHTLRFIKEGRIPIRILREVLNG